MARTVYSYPLLAGGFLGTSTATLDVADGYVVVVRDINLSCRALAGSAGRAAVQLNTVALVDFRVPDACERSFHREGRWVAIGPTTVQVVQTAGADFNTNYYISGYLLTTP